MRGCVRADSSLGPFLLGSTRYTARRLNGVLVLADYQTTCNVPGLNAGLFNGGSAGQFRWNRPDRFVQCRDVGWILRRVGDGCF